jgi:CRISPR-associated protein Csm1
MSIQIFLQGKLLGMEGFLLSPAHESETTGSGTCGEALLVGRSQWVSLLSEVLPRALLAEGGLAKVLLGSSGGAQFLAVLPDESRQQAEELLQSAAAGIAEMSGGHLRLVWAFTENLGGWSIVRKRLNDEMRGRRELPAAEAGMSAFEPFAQPAPVDTQGYFSEQIGTRIRQAEAVGWSPETPARILLEEGKHSWPLGHSPDSIPLARHAALDEDGDSAASASLLAERAEGRPVWGVLRGDVDSFEIRIRRLQTIEEHVQLSVLYKQFFAGELEVLCSMPDFWRKVSVIYSGGNDFAVYGSWDALILLCREIQRLFHRFNEENLKDFPGAEGKTISMALAFAPDTGARLASVYEEAGRKLEIAKSSGKDSLHLFDRIVEWRQLAHAAELKESLGRMVHQFGYSPEFLGEMMRFYSETDPAAARSGSVRFDRPWRYHRRLNLWAGGARDREFQKLRSRLIVDLIGRDAAQARLRPAGRIALEWAKLLTEA